MNIFMRIKHGKISADEIKKFHFSYSVGTYQYARYSYDLHFEKGVYTASILGPGQPDKDAAVLTAGNDFAGKLADLYNEQKLILWDGFRKNNKLVLDGNSFSLSVILTDLSDVSAHGYMRYPHNYGKVCGSIEGLFGSLLQNNK